MRKTFLLGFIFTTLMGIYAQNVFFPTTVGIVQTYAQKNNKGKVESYTRQTINNVQMSDDEITVLYTFETLDKNQKPKDPPATFPCKVTIKDDVVTLDMKEVFASVQQDAQLNALVEITGVPMEISGSLQPSETIKDANMLMTIDMGIMKMKTEIQITNGKCLAIEDITVPAGTFTCHKITQTTTTTIMKKKVTSTTISWYALGMGTIKTENYNDKNQLDSSMELMQLSK